MRSMQAQERSQGRQEGYLKFPNGEGGGGTNCGPGSLFAPAASGSLLVGTRGGSYDCDAGVRSPIGSHKAAVAGALTRRHADTPLWGKAGNLTHTPQLPAPL
jgi:hypothetical protein